ncbi:Prefoldin subunit family protein [Tritrichomonas foetus]|uniref:Prefoldin subunit 3 n=1 Tax=Tritrichomonas foetus TaxID=1144522 RepID=A0A1J4J968_9EUKA|nr:Prefoldin subunit family protein [Tritrichomonas foetus]|eukprot:OHS94227.1 Prefoldin subunit family protein [Tritrichomonas foetus]
MSETEKPATPLGIPKAEFIEDIAAAAPTMEDAEKLFQSKQEILSKYRYLEQGLLEKQQSLKASRPDVVNNLTAVKKLSSQTCQNDPITHFQISDSVYGTAKLTQSKTVALWLGANLMVEYPYEEAEALLQTNLDNLDKQLAEIENNLVFLRDQIITTEVTVSRLTNHIISTRRKAK